MTFTRHSHALDKPQQKHGCQCYSMSFNIIPHSMSLFMFPGWKKGGNLKKPSAACVNAGAAPSSSSSSAMSCRHQSWLLSDRHIADICWPCLTILIRLYTYDFIRYTALHNSRSSYSYLIIFYIYNIHLTNTYPRSWLRRPKSMQKL